MITLDIFGQEPNKKLNEAVGLDRSKVPNYPRDPATVQHRIDTAKAILSDPKSDPDSRQVAAAILAQHKDIKEYGDTARGQKMLGKVQKRAVDRVVSKKADTDPKYARKNQDTANRAWDRMTDKDVAESAGDIGREIIALYKKIYRLGDDAVDHVYHTYPTFRKLWNNYEGDLRSIVAEVNPIILQKLHNELLAAAQEEGLLEDGAGKFQLPGVGSWLNVGQQQQATDDTPGNFSIVVAGRQGKDFQAITLAKALETILPNDYPRSGWPNTPGSDRTPTHYVIQEVLKRGQAIVKDGIGSKDVADSIAVKFKKYGIPAYVEGALEEARAATASFRRSNKKRAELNAMSDEERKAYDKEQQEKQRKRDDARLERERQKNAAKKGVAEEGTRGMDSYERDVWASQQGFDRPEDHRGLRQELAHERNNLQVYINGKPWKVFPGRGYADSQEEFKFLQSMRAWAEKKSAATGKKWSVSLTGAEPTNEEQTVDEGRMGELAAQYDDYKTLSPREFFNLHKITKQQWLEKYKGLLQQQPMAEAGKKKDDELGQEVRDVRLQRAISKAKADFPTAGSGLEALAKDFMRSQDQDQDSLDKIRQIDQQQDRMLSNISKIDQKQNQEIADLDNQNSSLTQRLQQLQSVNDKLQQTLATMSGRKEKPKAEKPADTKPADKPSVNITTPANQPVGTQPKKEKTPSSMAATAKQLSAPKKADPMAAMAQRIQQGDQSITDKITGQKSLAFEPTDNVIVPRLQKKKYEPATDITDVEPKYYADLTSKIAQQAITDPEKAAQTYSVHENDEEEADYGDEYQDMVARVGQKAKQQEKDKPVDIKDLARRLAGVKLKDEK